MIVDSVHVGRVERPESVDDLAEIMRAETGTIAPIGAGTQPDFGNPLQAIDCAIDTRGLSRVTEYVPEDVTIHVESGVTLGQLQAALEEHNQILPLDPWNGPEATIGGIAATNAQGPLRTVGSIRDWIIGMHVVHVDGRRSRTGGRVVKNVSGYDLAKLYTGSVGSLALISEISFKLRARYEKTLTARLRLEGRAHVLDLLSAIRRGPCDPISLVWLGPEELVVVRFGEHPDAVEWQFENLPEGDWERFVEDEETDLWREVGQRHRELGDIVVRVVALPSRIGDVVERFKPDSWLAHAAAGVVLLGLRDPGEILKIREHFPAVIERGPIDVRRRIPTFGVGGREYELMTKIKHSFDPECRLNPGRHVDGERCS